MSNTINRLITFLKSIVVDGVVEVNNINQIELTKNYLPLSDCECVWLLSYHKHKELLLSLKRGDEKALVRVALPLYEELASLGEGALVIPLPQSNWRIFLRGHNHTLLIVDAALKHDKLKKLRLEKRNLIKTKETRKQAKLSRSERLREQKGVFSVRRPERLRGKTVILFDDIITTGATLSEARKVLLKAGAEKVTCVALAH